LAASRSSSFVTLTIDQSDAAGTVRDFVYFFNLPTYADTALLDEVLCEGGDESFGITDRAPTLGIAAHGPNEVVLGDAGVSIKSVLMPASVELALYEYLKRKHDQVEITVLSDECVKLAVRGE
jgi:hypothetical protein